MQGNPLTHCGGYRFGEGWINPTCTRTPGQPAALTRGFLKPMTIPTHPKDPITNPNQPQHNGKVLVFLGGGVYPVWIYEVTWGIPGYSCINVTAMADGTTHMSSLFPSSSSRRIPAVCPLFPTLLLLPFNGDVAGWWLMWRHLVHQQPQ